MALIVILIVLAIQRYGQLKSNDLLPHWVNRYAELLLRKGSRLMQDQGYLAVMVLILPVTLSVAILFAVLSSSMGFVGEAILGILVLWLCIDSETLVSEKSTEQGMILVYSSIFQPLFSVLFWYAITGPVGLITYAVIRLFLPILTDRSLDTLTEHMRTILNILDWPSSRLLGLSFALAGQFSPVFQSWMQNLFHVQDPHPLIDAWGELANDQHSPVANQLALIDRVLIIWLVFILLFTIGVWLG